jgi:hypothetical protein
MNFANIHIVGWWRAPTTYTYTCTCDSNKQTLNRQINEHL